MKKFNFLETIKRKIIILVIQIFICVVMLLISTNSLSGNIEQIGLTVITFAQRGFNSVGVFFSNTINALGELRELRMKYDELVAKMEEYKNLERGYIEIRQENDRLKEQLDFSTTLAYKKTAASIIGKDPENVYTTFIIDKGIADGLKKNLPVIAYQNGIEGLVGHILEVGYSSSIVIPLYDKGSYIASRLGRSRYDGLIAGSGSSEKPLLFKYVRKQAKNEIQYGDIVVTSGNQSLYPKDIVIGRVKETRSFDYQSSLEIDVDPILDFGKLEYVFVIQPDFAQRAD